jgi:hypothetical protein
METRYDYREEYGLTLGVFYERGIIPGRMVGWSKSGYVSRNPDNEVYFNANIFILGEGKIWFGDLDLTIDRQMLEDISTETGKKFYILRESDGRFGNDELSDQQILERAIAKIG